MSEIEHEKIKEYEKAEQEQILKVAVVLWWEHREKIFELHDFAEQSKKEFAEIMKKDLLLSVRETRPDEQYDEPVTTEEFREMFLSKCFSYLSPIMEEEEINKILKEVENE